jgi:signal transduction histidine kinase
VGWHPTPYALVGFAAATLFFLIVAAGWRRRSEPAAGSFVALVFALGAWALVYGIQLGFDTPRVQAAWQRLAFLVGGPVPMLWLLFTLQYTGREAWLTRPVRLAMILDPFLFGLLAVTNPVHGLVWVDAGFVTGPALYALDLTLGPGYLVHVALAYVVTPLGFGLLVLSALRSALYRTQAALVTLGSTPPFVMNLAYTFDVGLGPAAAVDFTPFAFVVTAPLLALALFRFDLLERVPVARERIVADAEDGFVVLDEDERIVWPNAVAEAILDGAPEGAPIRSRLPVTDGGDPSTDLEAALDGLTLTVAVDGVRRAYDVSRSPLADHHDRVVGHVVQFRNVTDRQRYEQRLEVANRVLRHNLRNRMNVISGWAEELARSDAPEAATAGRRIGETAADLLDAGEKVRTMIETAEYAAEPATPVEIAPRLAPIVDRIRGTWPEATVEADLAPGAAVAVPHPRLLTVALENLVENAVEHNDGESPRVWVEVEPAGPDEPYTEIRVADDGPGVPEAERAVLAEGAETPLRHGSGLGLWLVHWSVAACGGEVRFADNEPRGSVVTVALRPA